MEDDWRMAGGWLEDGWERVGVKRIGGGYKKKMPHAESIWSVPLRLKRGDLPYQILFHVVLPQIASSFA